MVTAIIPIVIVFLVGGFMALVIYGSRDPNSKVGNGQFDERQLIAQGKGFRLGFLIMVGVGFVFFIAEAILDRQFIGAGDALVITICFGTGAMAVYCILKDAYVSLKGSAGATLVSMFILTMLNLLRGIDLVTEKGPVTDGLLGACWLFFAMALMTAAISVALLVKMLLARRDRE